MICPGHAPHSQVEVERLSLSHNTTFCFIFIVFFIGCLKVAKFFLHNAADREKDHSGCVKRCATPQHYYFNFREGFRKTLK